MIDTSLLLTDEEYKAKFEGNHPTPYIYHLAKGQQVLFNFGVRHSRKPDDPQWEELAREWNEFLSAANDKRMVLFEGSRLLAPEGDRDATILKFGESGVLVLLAKSSGASFDWPDPTFKEEVAFLKQNFDTDAVAYFFFARSAGSWLRAGTMGTFDEVIRKAADAGRRIPGAPTDVSAYATIHERIFGKPLGYDQQETIIRASAPVYHDSVINDIARADSRFRNERIVLKAEKYWNDGYSIFMLFGTAHAVIQEPALRALVNGS